MEQRPIPIKKAVLCTKRCDLMLPWSNLVLRVFVPLDQRSENESSGSNHFEITKEITEFCQSGFTTQSTSRAHAWNGCSQSFRFRPLVKGNEDSGTRLDNLLYHFNMYISLLMYTVFNSGIGNINYKDTSLYATYTDGYWLWRFPTMWGIHHERSLVLQWYLITQLH